MEGPGIEIDFIPRFPELHHDPGGDRRDDQEFDQKDQVFLLFGVHREELLDQAEIAEVDESRFQNPVGEIDTES